MPVLPRNLRAKDVAEHHEVAHLVGHLDPDRGLAGDRGDDPNVGGRERVGDVVRQRQDLVDLGPGADLDLVERDRGTTVRGRHGRRHAERPERPLERLHRVLLVPPVGIARRRAPQQLQRRELVGASGDGGPGGHGGSVLLGLGLDDVGVQRDDALLDRRIVVLGLGLGHDDRILLVVADDAVRPSLGRDGHRLGALVPPFLLVVVSPAQRHARGVDELEAPLPCHGERRAGEDQDAEQGHAAAHDAGPERRDGVGERPPEERADPAARLPHSYGARRTLVAGARARVSRQDRHDRERSPERQTEADEHRNLRLLPRSGEQHQPPEDPDDRDHDGGRPDGRPQADLDPPAGERRLRRTTAPAPTAARKRRVRSRTRPGPTARDASTGTSSPASSAPACGPTVSRACGPSTRSRGRSTPTSWWTSSSPTPPSRRGGSPAFAG